MTFASGKRSTKLDVAYCMLFVSQASTGPIRRDANRRRHNRPGCVVGSAEHLAVVD